MIERSVSASTTLFYTLSRQFLMQEERRNERYNKDLQQIACLANVNVTSSNLIARCQKPL